MLTRVDNLLHTEIVKKKSAHHDHHEFVALASGAIILLIVMCGFFTFKTHPEYLPKEILNLVQLGNGENVSPNNQPVKAAMNIEDFTSNLKTVRGTLMDVTGGESEGMAYTLRKEGGINHMVIADLPEPSKGFVYEGWLVKENGEMEYFSTGVMEKEYDGRYTLMFQDDEQHDGFDFVVITLEEKVDSTPEAHVLEGRVR